VVSTYFQACPLTNVTRVNWVSVIPLNSLCDLTVPVTVAVALRRGASTVVNQTYKLPCSSLSFTILPSPNCDWNARHSKTVTVRVSFSPATPCGADTGPATAATARCCAPLV